jgi:DNA invertase Pin-like site-specific DNA recombinase
VSGATRAAIYCRTSREDEWKIHENQVENARRYCIDKGFVLTDDCVFEEVVSGTLDKQARLNLLLEAASKRNRSFDVVVFTSISRMTRGGIEAAPYTLHRLENSGVGWNFVEQPILNFDSTSPKLAKDIVLAVLTAIDEDYRSRIARATRAAYVKRKNLALASGEKVRWGRPPGAKNKEKGTPRLREGNEPSG